MQVRLLLVLVLFIPVAAAHAQKKERARDVGIPLDGAPGPLDAITDVAGVEVGQTTVITGSGKLVVGRGPVRTGVTAVLPRGKNSGDPVLDRKSTRLNSSHVKISYAVFCLKKKT